MGVYGNAVSLKIGGVTACLVGAGGGDGTCRWKGVMNQEDMDWGVGRWWWGGEACPDSLSLCQSGVYEVHAGEGGDYLLGIHRRQLQPV